MKNLIIIFTLSILTIANTANSQTLPYPIPVTGPTYEYVDDNTNITINFQKMHTCPIGFMSGFHEHKNDLLCFSNYGSVWRVGDGTDNFITRRSGMHACGLGTAMVGIHVRDDVLRCSTPEGGRRIDTNSEFVSFGGAGTLRYGMHACPEGWVMTGIHVVGNRFLCSLITR